MVVQRKMMKMSNEIDKYGKWTKEGVQKKNKDKLKLIGELANNIGKDHAVRQDDLTFVLCDNGCQIDKDLAKEIMELCK